MYLARLAQPTATGVPATRADGVLAAFTQQWDTIRETLLAADAALTHGVDNTSLPYRFEQLADMLLEEDASNMRTLGPCLEYVMENSLFTELFGLCAADEPQGVMRELMYMFARLVHGMKSQFLAQKGIAHAISQLVHHGMRLRDHPRGALARQDLAVSDALLLLLHELLCRISQIEPLFFLYLELTPPASRENGKLHMLSYLLSHNLAPAWAGFYARGALAVLVRLLAHQACKGDSASLEYLVGGGLADAFAASASAAYGLLPTHIDLVYTPLDGAVQHMVDTRKTALHTLALAPSEATLPLFAFIDTMWLAEQVIDACSAPAQADFQDMLEQLGTEFTQSMHTFLVERVLVPAAGAASADDGSAAAAILYHTCLLEALSSKSAVTQVICKNPTDQRNMSDLLADTIMETVPPELRAVAYRCAVLHMRCTAAAEARDEPAYVPPLDVMGISALGALVQSIQSPHFIASLGSRYFAHFEDVSDMWHRDQKNDVWRAVPAGGSRITFSQRRQVRISPGDCFLSRILGRICCFFTLPPAENVLGIDAISRLCRVPYLSMDGLLGGTAPVITFVFYMLSLQAQAFLHTIPDLIFFLGQRKNQYEALRVHARPKSPRTPGSLELPLLPPTSIDAALEWLEKMFTLSGWIPEQKEREQMTHTTVHTDANIPASGAALLDVSLQPCLPPASGPWSSIETGNRATVALSDLLDNIILLEEAIIELTCIASLRRAHGFDAYVA